MPSFSMEKEELLKIVSNKDTNENERINAFIELSNSYAEDGDTSNAMKYAAMATISTNNPRPDACITLGDRYLEINNSEWAIKWYESALSNVCYNCESKDYTWLPLIKIAQVYLILLNFDKATKYADSAELFDKNNEDIQQVKNAIIEAKNLVEEKCIK